MKTPIGKWKIRARTVAFMVSSVAILIPDQHLISGPHTRVTLSEINPSYNRAKITGELWTDQVWHLWE